MIIYHLEYVSGCIITSTFPPAEIFGWPHFRSQQGSRCEAFQTLSIEKVFCISKPFHPLFLFFLVKTKFELTYPQESKTLHNQFKNLLSNLKMVTSHVCDCQDLPSSPRHIQTCSTYSNANLLLFEKLLDVLFRNLREKCRK